MFQTDHLASRVDNNSNDFDTNTSRSLTPTWLEIFATSFIVLAVPLWPINLFFKITGDLCHSVCSRVIFCGVPPLAVLLLWIAMLQGKGRFAVLKEGRTAEEYKRMKQVMVFALFPLITLSVIMLLEAMSRICSDSCATGLGDGDACVKHDLLSNY